MSLVEQQPAYVLHSRAWRETSVIVDLFTLYSGRVALIIKGARKSSGKQAAKVALLQPFTPLMVSFSGRGELRTAHQIDAAGPPLSMLGQRLYSGLYANELLLKLLAIDDAHENLFAYYQTLLGELANKLPLEQCLRPFEVHLMDELGYHIALDKEFETGAPIQADGYYQLRPLQGLCLFEGQTSSLPLIKGSSLLNLAAGDYTNQECLKYAKYMARANLDQLLGGQQLRSRTFFQAMAAQTHSSDQGNN
jgi:DNA repair protein RecO (recombination protein O)